jgi:iron complex outermembrane recepter protein
VEAAGEHGRHIDCCCKADTLLHRDLNQVNDLPQLVPGLTIQQSHFNSSSFALRGVGFFNSDLATPSAVTVYVDEAPCLTRHD